MLDIRNDLPKEDLQKIAGEVTLEGSELVMTVAEEIRQEGLESGVKKGELKRAKATAKNMIVDGESIEKIMRYTELSKEEIEEIKKEMLN